MINRFLPKIKLDLIRNILFLIATVLFLAHISGKFFFDVGYDSGMFALLGDGDAC